MLHYEHILHFRKKNMNLFGKLEATKNLNDDLKIIYNLRAQCTLKSNLVIYLILLWP